MKFPEFLKRRKQFIVIYTSVNLFALFVNIFGIEGVIQGGDRNCVNCQTKASIHLLTDEYYLNNYVESKQSNFWPFSGITRTMIFGNYSIRKASIFSPVNNDEYKVINFCGLFFMYDYSEFIAYLFLLLLFFYFKWEKQKI